MSLHIRDIEGRRFSRLDYGLREYKVDVTAPSDHHLLNFVVEGVSAEGEEVSLLVLDPYGDDTLPQSIRERVFGKNSYTVAIDQKTGDICVAIAEEDGADLFLYVERPTCHFNGGGEYRVPAPMVGRLYELMNRKRPYRCHIDPLALENFIDREEGYHHLSKNVVFTFEFEEETSLEVWGDSYRKVGRWS